MATQNAPPELDLLNIRKPSQLGRVLGWGGLATIALAAVVLTGQTETGSQRLQTAIVTLSDPLRMIADLTEPTRAVAQIPPRNDEAKAETQRLAAELRDQTRDFAADRAQLVARIATLEHNLEDMTGSIKQQSEQLAAARAADTRPPVPSTPATIVSALPPLAPLKMPAIQPSAAKSEEAKTEAVPVPPVRLAAAPTSEPAPEQPAKLEIGIDLGGGVSLDALRQHWAAVKANYGPLLTGLHPLAWHNPKQPSGVSYRLVAGPLPNAAEAAKLCARFSGLRTGCRPAKFDGAQLAEH